MSGADSPEDDPRQRWDERLSQIKRDSEEFIPATRASMLRERIDKLTVEREAALEKLAEEYGGHPPVLQKYDLEPMLALEKQEREKLQKCEDFIRRKQEFLNDSSLKTVSVVKQTKENLKDALELLPQLKAQYATVVRMLQNEKAKMTQNVTYFELYNYHVGRIDKELADAKKELEILTGVPTTTPPGKEKPQPTEEKKKPLSKDQERLERELEWDAAKKKRIRDDEKKQRAARFKLLERHRLQDNLVIALRDFVTTTPIIQARVKTHLPIPPPAKLAEIDGFTKTAIFGAGVILKELSNTHLLLSRRTLRMVSTYVAKLVANVKAVMTNPELESPAEEFHFLMVSAVEIMSNLSNDIASAKFELDKQATRNEWARQYEQSKRTERTISQGRLEMARPRLEELSSEEEDEPEIKARAAEDAPVTKPNPPSDSDDINELFAEYNREDFPSGPPSPIPIDEGVPGESLGFGPGEYFNEDDLEPFGE